MKTILIAILMTLIIGCESQLQVDLAQVNRDTRVYIVFDGVLNGVATPYDIDYYYCNPTDLFVYRIDTTAAELNADNTQVSCTEKTYTKLISVNSQTDVVSDFK